MGDTKIQGKIRKDPEMNKCPYINEISTHSIWLQSSRDLLTTVRRHEQPAAGLHGLLSSSGRPAKSLKFAFALLPIRNIQHPYRPGFV